MRIVSAYACIDGWRMDEVKDRAPMGTMSDLTVVGGLPAVDMESMVETEGESEYERC